MYNRNLLRFDWAIKKLLRNKADYSILEGFLSELLREDIVIPKSIEDAENNSIIKAKQGSYPNYDNQYMPDTKKQKAEIERFILNLKLGTALMSDIDDVLKRIESIK